MNRPVRREPNNNSGEAQKYLKIIVRRWYWLVFSIMLALGVAKIYNLLAPRTYRVSCEIVVGEKENQSASNSQLVGGIDFNTVNPINKEIGVLKSKNIAEQTLQQLNFNIAYYELIKGIYIKRRRFQQIPFRLHNDSQTFLPQNEIITISIINSEEYLIKRIGDQEINKVVKFGKLFAKDEIKILLKKTPESIISDEFIGKEYLFYLKSSEEVLNEFWGKLRISISPTSQNILVLSVDAENPYQAIAYLEKLTEIYDVNDLELRNRMASNTINFIDNQLKILTSQLLEAENRLINFKRQNKIYDLGGSNSFSNELLDLEDAVKKTQIELQSHKQLKTQLDTIAEGKNIVLPVLFTLADSRLSNGIENLNEQVIAREVFLKNQKPNSPAVIRINQKIQVEAEALKSYLDQEIGIVNEQLQQLTRELNSLEAELINLPSVERELAKLTRDFSLTENLYNLYQQKRIEAKLAEASTVSNVRVLDPPSKDDVRLVSPQKNTNLQIAALIGLAFPIALLILLELLSNQVRDFQDITNRIKLPVVGKLSHSKSNIYLPTREFPLAAITESFRTLHAKLNFLLVDEKQKVVAITSGSSGDGKTFCAMNLSSVIASAGKKVLLIGLDLRRPKIHEVFGLDNTVGLTSYLIGNTTWEDLVYKTDQNNLWIMNSGPIPPNPVELIEHERMHQLIQKCRAEYDYIIIDSPPIGLVADALLLNKFVDVYLFVIRLDYTKKTIFSLLQEMHENQSLNHLSLVFNDIRDEEKYGYKRYNTYYQKEEVRTRKESIIKRILFRR